MHWVLVILRVSRGPIALQPCLNVWARLRPHRHWQDTYVQHSGPCRATMLNRESVMESKHAQQQITLSASVRESQPLRHSSKRHTCKYTKKQCWVTWSVSSNCILRSSLETLCPLHFFCHSTYLIRPHHPSYFLSKWDEQSLALRPPVCQPTLDILSHLQGLTGC